MRSTSPPTPTPASDAPLDNFSHCHDGILRHLTAMDALPARAVAAEQARQQASDVLAFFRKVVLNHHEEEERLLFVAVHDSAATDKERSRVSDLTTRLTREHRQVEALFAKLEPELKKMAKGQPCQLDDQSVQALVAQYRAHAQFEEAEFLPLSRTILGRNSNHMAALGLSLHIRHVAVADSPI